MYTCQYFQNILGEKIGEKVGDHINDFQENRQYFYRTSVKIAEL
jgi:hypothetical protein